MTQPKAIDIGFSGTRFDVSPEEVAAAIKAVNESRSALDWETLRKELGAKHLKVTYRKRDGTVVVYEWGPKT